MNMFKMIFRILLTPFVFIKNVSLYFYSHLSTSEDECVKSLKDEGFYFFDRQLDDQSLLFLSESFSKLIGTNGLSEYGQNNGRIVVTDECRKDGFKDLIFLFEKKAKDYFRTSKISVELAYFQKSKSEFEIDNIPGGSFHLDDNKKNLKFFIYLSDVLEVNGPFVYAAKTHGPFSISRLIRWFFWELTLSRKFLYTKPSREFDSAVSITGKAGSVFCADTTGFHKASRVKEGVRNVFVVSFAEVRLDPYSFIKRKSLI